MISRGIKSEKIYTLKSLTRETKEQTHGVQKYPSINDTYSRDFLCFANISKISCNCNSCKKIEMGENIKLNKIGHNLRQISYEKIIIDNLEVTKRNDYIENLVKTAINYYKKDRYPNSHFRKLKNTLKVIQEVI